MVKLDYSFLADMWVNRDECKEFLDFEIGLQKYRDIYVLSGAISTDSLTFAPPFRCDDGTEWCIFLVEKLTHEQVKKNHYNEYRLIVSAVDDEVFERYFHTIDEVYQFLDLFKYNDLTTWRIDEYFLNGVW